MLNFTTKPNPHNNNSKYKKVSTVPSVYGKMVRDTSHEGWTIMFYVWGGTAASLQVLVLVWLKGKILSR